MGELGIDRGISGRFLRNSGEECWRAIEGGKRVVGEGGGDSP